MVVLGVSTVLTLLLGLWIPAYMRSRDLRRRVGALAALSGGTSIDMGGRRRSRGARPVPRDGRNPLLHFFEVRLDRAALDLTAGEVVAATAILAVSGGFVAAVLWGPALALVGAPLAGWLPLLYIRIRHGRRQAAFRDQLADSVSLLASTVRAGHSLLQGLDQVAQESSEPTRSAMQQVVREMGLGASQDEALDRMAERFPSEDLDLIVTSINVQHQVGGSLAEILDEMAATLRERARIEGDIRALTAQQRYSAYILALLPVFVAVALFFISNDYVSLLLEGALRFAALGAALMVIVGFLIMRRIATIDV
ncbi:MAG: type II secretion system F family protein [Candidatus Limnocylindria bacterium]